MQQAKNSIPFIIRIVVVSVLTLLLFLALGTFYKAIHHSIGLNVLVWFVTTVIAYYLYYFGYYLLRLRFKKWRRAPIFDGWSILAGLVFILILCLFDSIEADDYLYVEVMGVLSGIIAFFQIMYEVLIKRTKLRKDEGSENE